MLYCESYWKLHFSTIFNTPEPGLQQLVGEKRGGTEQFPWLFLTQREKGDDGDDGENKRENEKCEAVVYNPIGL